MRVRTDHVMRNNQRMNCRICGRTLDQKDDPLSFDCAGDCWGGVGEAEAAMGWEPSLKQVREEFALGLRPNWTAPSTSG